MFQMLGIFSEFEREMIRSRVQAGMARVKREIAKTGRYETKKGTVIKRFGRPGAEPHKLAEARKLGSCWRLASESARSPRWSASAPARFRS